MINLLGEYEVRVDAKGRVMLPAALKRQVPAEARDSFVVNRGFEKCLVLYPMNEWEKESEVVNKLNLFVRENRDFMRAFRNGATELSLDNANRLLLPKQLMIYAGIKKEAVMFAYSNRVEIWSKKEYKRVMNGGEQDFAALAEKVMGKNNHGEGEK